MIEADVKAVPPAAAAGGRRLVVTDASLEWMKWLAVVGMVLDHVNWFFFATSIATPQASPHAWMNDIGRVVFPMFAFVFGINLARVLDDDPSRRAARFRRMMLRLLVAGVVAQGAFWLLRGYFWPLNVLFTFALAAAIAWCVAGSSSTSGRSLAALALFAFGGLLVEYWWVGVGLTLAAFHFAQQRTLRSLWPSGLALVLLAVISPNAAVLAAAPVIWALSHVRVRLPRWPGTFHFFYAGHLWLLAGLAAALGR